jgi:SNARE domain
MKETDDLQRQVYGGDDTMSTVSTLAPPPVYGMDFSRQSSFPTLDLTSGIIGMSAGEATGSLPRPHGIAPGSGVSSGGGVDYGMRNRRVMNTSGGGGGGDLPTYSGAYSSYSPVVMTPLDVQRMDEENGEQLMQLIPDQDYLQSRADAMSTVESNIVELGTIFNKLAVMVSEHREMVQRVEDNTEETNSNINLSMSTLSDTLTNLRSNRALLMKLFSILVVFIIVFIIAFA